MLTERIAGAFLTSGFYHICCLHCLLTWHRNLSDSIRYLVSAISEFRFNIVYHRYHFVIEFFLPVDKHGCEYEVRDSDVRFSLRKKEADWWPRLQYQNIRVRMT